jgi:hypothetical protein
MGGNNDFTFIVKRSAQRIWVIKNDDETIWSRSSIKKKITRELEEL